MRLWILRPINPDAGPWSPWYDRCFGFVIRADSESQARRETEGATGDEQVGLDGSNPWLDATLTTCVELTETGDAGIIISDFHSA